MNIQHLKQKDDLLIEQHISNSIQGSSLWYGRYIKYYNKYKNIFILIKTEKLAIDIVYDQKINTIDNKIENIKIINLMDSKFENKEIEISQQDFEELLLLAMKLHLKYIDVIINQNEDPSFIKLPPGEMAFFLKSLAKLNKLLQNTKENPQREFIDKVCNLYLEYIFILDDLVLDPFPGQTTGYFVSVDDKKVMVFKPADSDPNAFSTVPRGQGYKRQMAAYLMDLASGGRLNVPLTILGEYQNRPGSVQLFLKNDGMVHALKGSEIKKISTSRLQLVSIHRSKLYELDGNLVLCQA